MAYVNGAAVDPVFDGMPVQNGKAHALELVCKETLPQTFDVNALAKTEDIRALQGAFKQMAQIMMGMDARIRQMEKMLGDRPINSTQEKQLRSMAKARAEEICERYVLDAKTCVPVIRKKIYQQIMKRHSVSALRDIPASQMDMALDGIRKYADYSLVRYLRG